MRSSDDDGDPKLPHDVAVEVLKRLPLKSLLRFRCVCRSWRPAIDDPRFVALHLTHSALDASNCYLVCLDWCRHLCSLFSNESLTLPSRSQIEVPFVTPAGRYDFVGSCNGLICVAELSRNGFSQAMYLWNSFTGKHKAVPQSGQGHQLMVHVVHVVLHMDNGRLMVHVAVLNDSLAVFINLMDAVAYPERHSICSVWVMMEYGAPESWTKLYSFEACGLVTGFDGFVRNGKLLMEINGEKRVSWDPITGQYANFPLSTQCKLVTVVESLVSP